MAQLDFFSYPDQYFLVSITFWLFYAGSIFLFIIPFVQVMKMRSFISGAICYDELFIETFKKKSNNITLTSGNVIFFK